MFCFRFLGRCGEEGREREGGRGGGGAGDCVGEVCVLGG